jgi:hypothetical protein
MAKSDFETTKMEKLYPGLTVQPGVVDKSGAIDNSLLTTLAGGAMLGLGTYEQLEKNRVTKEANALAYDHYEEALANTPDGRNLLISERTALQNELPGLEGDARADIINRVDAITSTLSKGEAQGVYSPYESMIRNKRRVQDLVDNNTWAQDEIINRYAQTTNQLGTNDLYTYQIKAQETAQKIALEEYKQKVEFIDPFIQGSGYDLPRDQLEVAYSFYKNKSSKYERAKFLLENSEGLSKVETYAIWKDAGGTANIKEMLHTEITQGVQAILLDNTNYPDYNSKVLAARELISGFETAVAEMYDELPQDKEDVKSFNTTMNATFELLRAEMTNDLSLEGLEKYKKNVASIVKTDLDTKFMMQFGNAEQAQKTLNSMADTLAKLKGAGFLSRELEESFRNEMKVYVKAMTEPKNTSYSATEIDVINDPDWGVVVEQAIRKADTSSQPGDINLVTATLNNIHAQNFNSKSATKLDGYDLQLTALSQLKPEVFKHFYSNPDFKPSIIKSLGEFRQYTMAVFQRESQDTNYNIILDRNTGRLTSPDALPPKMQGNLTRANSYIKIRAMMEETDPIKIAERILKDELNNLEYNADAN